MDNNQGAPWFRARLKTLIDLRIAWPLAWCWKNPYLDNLFPPADEVVIPYLGETVWVRELDTYPCEILYEIKDSGGLIVLAEWIDHFLPDDSVPPSGWKASKRSETWMERIEDRSLIVEDTLIIHG